MRDDRAWNQVKTELERFRAPGYPDYGSHLRYENDRDSLFAEALFLIMEAIAELNEVTKKEAE